MALENGEKELLIRIEERVKTLTEQFMALNIRLTNDFVTKESCQVRQIEHERQSAMTRAETVAKICVLVSISVSLIWAVLKHS